MTSVAGILRVLLLIGLTAAIGACAGGRSGASTSFPAPGARLAEARGIAQQAAEIATKAKAARVDGRDKEADKLAAKAIEQYRQALNVSGDMADAWNNLGVLLVDQKDLMGAADAFTIAMQQSPADPRPCENLGLVYSRAGWSEESLKYYDLAIERSPNYLPALRGAIQQAHLLGQADEARLKQVRRALLLEQDERWQMFFEREQVRISGRLETDRRGGGQR